MAPMWSVFDLDNDSDWNFDEMSAFLGQVGEPLTQIQFAGIKRQLGVEGELIPFEAIESNPTVADTWLTEYLDKMRIPAVALLGRNATDYMTKVFGFDSAIWKFTQPPFGVSVAAKIHRVWADRPFSESLAKSNMNTTVDQIMDLVSTGNVGSRAMSSWVRGFPAHHVLRFTRENKTCFAIGPLTEAPGVELTGTRWGLEYGEYALSGIDFTKYAAEYGVSPDGREFNVRIEMWA
ncbi:unnamed protein product [Vitrella brassicaformis CCMP3155]|uniref:Uncharacterized protein n=1 Tax=Vitrella brassicaformis (strain CCMP3155) TaxID=1169540 RepID=A0A0G4EQ35_VITBC|nr:unnamed protein product [Vitrella brassicaformis CCMP3155]|eukprot:CEL99965.1 unnamed protein product [Vitrella brassicaformis CCMP3155]